MYVHPIETAMVQQQLVPTGQKIPPLPSMLGKMVRTEGISGWYRGITASLLREMVYSSLRFGLYEPFRDAFAKMGPTDSSSYRVISRITAGFTAGGMAAAIATPTELLKVRAQGYAGKPPSFPKLVAEVGGKPFKVKAFYEGTGTIVTRALVLGATKMAVYNEIKDFLKRVPNHPDSNKATSNFQSYLPGFHSWVDSDYQKYGHVAAPSTTNRLGLVFTTAFMTGLAVTCTTSPFTNARTFIMTNPGQFKGMADALKYIKKTYGVLGYFRGFGAQWARFGPYALIQFTTWEQLRYMAGIKPI